MLNLNCFLLNLSILVSSCSCQCGDDQNWNHAKEFQKCYYRITFDYSKDRVTWSDAERKCQSLGSHLVSIHTQQEDTYIAKLLRKYSDNYTYLGLRRYENSTLSWTDKSLNIELAKNKTASDRSEGCYLRWDDMWYKGSCDQMMAGRIINSYLCQKDASRKKIIYFLKIQSTLDIVTLHLREIRYRVQIFGADFGCSYGWYNVKAFRNKRNLIILFWIYIILMHQLVSYIESRL